ncbi:sugar porter family MFS transporter [Oceanobacillus timonensis]|uniref:sugar porter family MFS transporter n=1 Tax=Oceanobacillus timonensis TaxID=1926285 RepID=UPI0009BA5C51|nr:sugar porter family MFS transporter [Oceanobacillus timonensis]
MQYVQANENNRYLLAIVMTVGLAGLLFGYDTAVISGAEQHVQKYLINSIGLGSFAHGFTVSSAHIGCIIGGLISGLLANKLGRKKTLILAGFLFFFSALGSAYPEMFFFTKGDASFSLLIAFNTYRIIGGIGIGIGAAIAPMYISEISPEQSRGKYVAVYTISIGIGQLSVYTVNLLIASAQTTAWVSDIGWRYMFASEMIPALLFLSLLFFVPETPRYLVFNNEIQKASSILERVHNSKERASQIISEIKKTIFNKTSQKARLFSYGGLVIFVGVAVHIFQPLIGINVIMYYAPRIFESMGVGQIASMFQTVIVGIVNVIFMTLALKFVDSLGRKPLLMVGSIGCAISLFLVAILGSMNVFGIITLVSILLYVACFQLTWGVVTWIVVSEVFPNKIRGKAVALASVLHWIANLAASSMFPMLNDAFGPASFTIYGGLCVLSVFFIWKFLPETKGKKLEEIEEIWSKRPVENQRFQNIK